LVFTKQPFGLRRQAFGSPIGEHAIRRLRAKHATGDKDDHGERKGCDAVKLRLSLRIKFVRGCVHRFRKESECQMILRC
jgi:hypothetical protein